MPGALPPTAQVEANGLPVFGHFGHDNGQIVAPLFSDMAGQILMTGMFHTKEPVEISRSQRRDPAWAIHNMRKGEEPLSIQG